VNPLQTIKNFFSPQPAPKNQVNLVGAPSFATHNPAFYNHFHSEEYASAYPNIRAISNEYMTVLPKAIDGNGKEIQNNPIINALYHPNQMDSVVSFNEKLAVSTLALRKTYLLVWRNEGGEARPGGDFGFKGANIAGFTFLERPGITRRDGKTFYNVGSQEFNENEVIVLPGGVNPHDLYGGYSPTEAAVRWISLDDYIADFQKGFFENNAIPAGMFKIVAATTKEYDDVVDTLQSRHRGSGNNNNVTYTHAPIDPTSGKPADAQIEWIPFQQSNKDIDFKSLFEQTNHRIDTAYGVPQIVKGVDDAATYANAQVAERGFAKRAVLPLLTRNYSQITHELNRITGGIGIAVTFTYTLPEVSDEKKVEAEVQQIQAGVITSMLGAGFTLGSIVDGFDLPKGLKLLSVTDTSAAIVNDKPEVDEGNEVKTAPDPEKIDGITPLNKEKPKGTNPKAALSDEQKLENVARKYLRAQVDRAVKDFKQEVSNEVNPDPLEDELVTFVAGMMATISPILFEKGEEGYEEGLKLLRDATIPTTLVTQYTLSDTVEDGYTAYMRRVGESYGSDTAAAIREVLATSANQGLTERETEQALKNVVSTSEYRVKRLAVTELNRSNAIGGIEAIKEIKAETGVNFEKSLFHAGGAECEYCRALEGYWVNVDQPLVSLGEAIEGVDGGTLVNDFVSNEGYDPHPNGGGVAIYRVVKT